MADFSFSPRFLQELAEWEKIASASERELVDRALAAIVTNPTLPGRVPSFYDPLAPSHLYRAAKVMIHYRVENDSVQFLNLFFSPA
ncbi:MAG: hypothetical protein EXR78_04165 [Deltaproteobacteria bacterium]|nr:hypothetical protein [Deltaproteobacteria bacterium]